MAVLALALLVAACGSGDDEAAPAVADIPGAEGENAAGADGDSDMSPEAAQLAFEQCMKKQGVSIDLGGDSDGESIEGDDDSAVAETNEDNEKFEAAMEECGSILSDSFGELDTNPDQEAAMKDAQAAFARCMADRGFEQSSDDNEEEEGVTEGSEDDVLSFDTDDPEALQDALSQCESVYDDAGLGADGDNSDDEGSDS
ncbi:MAG: hypothetical protein AAGD35_20370 [Actinomycetota bacterium]